MPTIQILICWWISDLMLLFWKYLCRVNCSDSLNLFSFTFFFFLLSTRKNGKLFLVLLFSFLLFLECVLFFRLILYSITVYNFLADYNNDRMWIHHMVLIMCLSLNRLCLFLVWWLELELVTGNVWHSAVFLIKFQANVFLISKNFEILWNKNRHPWTHPLHFRHRFASCKILSYIFYILLEINGIVFKCFAKIC